MSVSVSGSCSHTVDPVTHQNVYDSTFGIHINIPHFGEVFSLELDRHSGPDGRTLNETISLGVGAHAHTWEVSFSAPAFNPPSSVSGGSSPLSGLLSHWGNHSSAPALPVPPAQAALGSSSHDSNSGHGGGSLDLHGTVISLPHSWHH